MFKKVHRAGVRDICLSSLKDRNSDVIAYFTNEKNTVVHYSLPSFEVQSESIVPQKSCLVKNCSEPSKGKLTEQPDRIVGITMQENQVKLNIYELVNSDPVNVLQRLIKDGELKQALEFCLQNSIPQTRYHQYLLTVRNNLSFEVVMQSLLQIEDTDFVCQYVFNYETEDLSQVSKLLQLIRKSGKLSSKENIRMLHSMSNRLGTFIQLKTFDTSLWNNNWQSFCKSDMLVNIQNAIANQNISQALILWRRHFVGI